MRSFSLVEGSFPFLIRIIRANPWEDGMLRESVIGFLDRKKTEEERNCSQGEGGEGVFVRRRRDGLGSSSPPGSRDDWEGNDGAL